MMKPTNLKIQLEAMAINAYIEAMRAANKHAELNGMTPPYDEWAFNAKAQELQSLAWSVDYTE